MYEILFNFYSVFNSFTTPLILITALVIMWLVAYISKRDIFGNISIIMLLCMWLIGFFRYGWLTGNTLLIAGWIIILAVLVGLVAYIIPAMHSMRRAGKSAWVVIVPLYGTYVMGQIANEPQLAHRSNFWTLPLYLYLLVTIVQPILGIVAIPLVLTWFVVYFVFGYRTRLRLWDAFYGKTSAKNLK